MKSSNKKLSQHSAKMNLAMAYIGFLAQIITAKALQTVAQRDIVESSIQSEALIYFAHVLDDKTDDLKDFNLALNNIAIEFEWPKRFHDLQEHDLTNYVTYLVNCIVNSSEGSYKVFHYFELLSAFFDSDYVRETNLYPQYGLYNLHKIYGATHSKEIIEEIIHFIEYKGTGVIQLSDEDIIASLQKLSKILLSQYSII